MGQSPIRVIFFDAAGTLFHVKGSVGEVYVRYAQKYGVQSGPRLITAVNEAFAEAFQKAPPPIFSVKNPEKLKQCERLWWFDLVHAVFYRVGMFEGFDDYFEDVYEVFSTAEPWAVYPEVVDVLKSFREQNFELGVISNFDTRFYRILRELELAPYFDSITISSLAGYAKPAQKIFQHALDQHAVDPQEALHVGDGLEEDFEGARAASLMGILLDRKGQYSHPGAFSIQNLQELPGILSRL